MASILFLMGTGLHAQTDTVQVFPSSVDIRMVGGANTAQLVVQVQIHGTNDFGGVLSALTVTIRYDAASGASLDAGSSFCPAWSAFTPSPMVVNNGTAYRTYNGFGNNLLGDAVADGGCGIELVPEQWYTVTTIDVIGSACTTFTLGNDAWTQQTNRNYYISTGGTDVTGNVVGGPVSAGNCTPDCLGVPGGTALPGTACDDGDANTVNDAWNADCVCVGTTVCLPPAVTSVSSDSPVCSNAALHLGVTTSGTAPLTYAWTGIGTFSPSAASANVTVSDAVTGNFHVLVSNACGSTSYTVPVVVHPAPSATIVYAGSPYCGSGAGASVSFTGSSGGMYASTPAGLSVNAVTGAIDLAPSTAGTYTVAYVIAASGGCPIFSTSTNVVVTAMPSATIAYAGSPYCGQGTTVSVIWSGSASGTYTSSPTGLALNGNTGAINIGGSATGAYSVTYGIAAAGGCPAFNTTTGVTIDAPMTWYADADADGVGDAADSIVVCTQPSGYVATSGDGCPDDPDKLEPGACGCGVPDTDTDGDGTADCIDSCPTLAGGIGDSCDDDDPDTENDVITADCICEGTVIMGITESNRFPAVTMDLFPNPSRDGQVTLAIRGLPLAVGSVIIMIQDATGRQMHSETAAAVGGTVHHPMDLGADLSQGLYMVEVIVDGQRHLRRLVLE